MASRSKSLPLLVLLVVLLAGAWIVQRLGQPSRSGTLDRVTLEPPLVQPAADLPEPGDQALAPITVADDGVDFGPLETRVIYPLELELSLLQAGVVDVADDLAPPRSGANARLKGSLTSAGKPLTGQVSFLYGPNKGRVLRTDQGGLFGASDLFPGVSLVRIEADQGLNSERQIALRSLSTTTLPIGFTRGGSAQVYGRVLDPGGEPLVSARVRFDGQVSITDQDGIFYFPRVTPGKIMAVVDVPGYARHMEFLSIARATVVKSDQITFRLAREAVMEVSIAEALGHSGPAELYLLPTTGGRDYPWHLVNPIKIYGTGPQTVRGLGSGSLVALLFKTGAAAKPRRRSIRLYDDRVNKIVLHLEPNKGLHGRVLLDGKPQSNIQMRLEAPNSANATIRLLGQRRNFGSEALLPHLPVGAQTLTTDSRGRFHFTTWEELDSRYYLSAVSPDGRLGAKRIISTDDRSVELELKPLPHRMSSVQVVTQGRYQGLPIKVTVQGQPREPRTVLAGDDLTIEDLPAGLWRFDASWGGRTVSRAQRIEVREDEVASVEIDLPEGAIEGQTDRERAKARR